MGNEGTGVTCIVAAAAEDDPSTVRRPGVIALSVVGVDFVHRPDAAVLKVHQVEVGLVVPDVEHTVAAESEHQVATVGRDTRQSDTFAEAVGTIHQLAGTEFQSLGVEGLLIKVIPYFFGTEDDLGLVADSVAELEVGTTVIDGLAVGGPEREDLELCRIVLDVGHLVLLHVVGNEVAGRVEHLNLVQVAGVEAQAGVVGGIDDERQPRMPGRIDAS